jgi:hypothetical protein
VAGVLPERILVHTAVPISFEEPQSSPAEWIEGEPGPSGGGEPVVGVAFACVLFLPGPGGQVQNEFRSRVVREPTLMYNPTRGDDTPIVVLAENELMVTAPELAPWTGGETVRWLTVGDPQPFGPPGQVYGLQATLRQVKD